MQARFRQSRPVQHGCCQCPNISLGPGQRSFTSEVSSEALLQASIHSQRHPGPEPVPRALLGAAQAEHRGPARAAGRGWVCPWAPKQPYCVSSQPSGTGSLIEMRKPSLRSPKVAPNRSAIDSIRGELAKWVPEFLEMQTRRESDCRPKRGAQYSYRDRSLALADTIGLPGFPGTRSTKFRRKQFPTDSARACDREGSGRRGHETRRGASNPCERRPLQSQLPAV